MQLFEQALGRWRGLGAQAEEAMTLLFLSRIAYHRGDSALAGRHAEAGLTLFRAIGHGSGAALALCRLAQLARDRRDDHHAALAYQEALQLWTGLRDRWFRVVAIAGLAELASAYGPVSSAATLLGSINALAEEVGNPLLVHTRINCERAAAAARVALGAVRFAELHTAGRAVSLEEATAIAAAIPVPAGSTDRGLTPREQEVLRLLAAGHTDQQIADALFLSRRTVNAHVAHVLAKLDIRTRREAADRARVLGLPLGDEPSGYT